MDSFKLAIVFLTVLPHIRCTYLQDLYEETFQVKKLANGFVYTHFEFSITSPGVSNDTKLFPRALGEILDAHQIREIHFTLSQGYWRLESWEEPLVPAPTGAHLITWFESNDTRSADKNWKGFTSRLSGLTCASLNFLDEKSAIKPQYAYRPNPSIFKGVKETVHVRVGSLPRENVCTENLTPWSKLLPCGISRGLASLLRSKALFNTHYHSEGIHFIRNEDGIQLKLTLSLVFHLSSTLRPTDNFPKQVLGSLAIFPCQPSSSTSVLVWKNGEWKKLGKEVNMMKIEDIPDYIETPEQTVFTPMKYIGGYGQEYGTMVVQMRNHLTDAELNVLYVEVLPWYIRPYLHTMKVEIEPSVKTAGDLRGKLFHYTPGQDRLVLHKLEMDFTIPPSSTLTLSFLVEKGHLKWNEYPPDANHGFYLEAAHFEVNSTKFAETRSYYSRILLVNLSTPDFSMPYNVICLTCTVVALAFGPIHNITTKELKLSILTSKKDWLRKVWSKLRDKFRKKSSEKESEDDANKLDEVKGPDESIEENLK